MVFITYLDTDLCGQIEIASAAVADGDAVHVPVEAIATSSGTLLAPPSIPLEPPSLCRAWSCLCEDTLVLLPISCIEATSLVRQTVDANVQRLMYQMQNNYLVSVRVTDLYGQFSDLFLQNDDEPVVVFRHRTKSGGWCCLEGNHRLAAWKALYVSIYSMCRVIRSVRVHARAFVSLIPFFSARLFHLVPCWQV